MRRLTATTGALAIAAAGLVAASAGTAQASTCPTARLPLPDASCTPGACNADVTQSNINNTICVSGWTATVRPLTSCTNWLKAQGIINYRCLDNDIADYEEPPGPPRTRRCAPRSRQPVA